MVSAPLPDGRDRITPVEYEFLRLYFQLDEDRRALLRLVAQAFLDAQRAHQSQQAA